MAARVARVAVGSSAAASFFAARWFQHNYASSEPTKKLDSGASVVVVGAGVVGIATAHELAQRGYHVRVLEQSGEVCGTQSASWGNAGTLGTSNQTKALAASPSRIVAGLMKSSVAPSSPGSSMGVFFDPSTLSCPYFWAWGLTFLRTSFGGDITAHSDAHWKDLNAAAQAAVFETATREGLLSEADMRMDGRTAVRTAVGGGAADEATAAAAAFAAREPHTECPNVVDVDVRPLDGQGSCEAFTKGLARVSTSKYGVVIDVGAAVRKLRLDDDGRCTGVLVERASADGSVRMDTIEAAAVVLCAGACVAPLASTARVYVPVQPLRGYSLTAKARGASVRHHVTFSPSSLYVSRLGSSVRFTSFGEMTPVRSDGPGAMTGGRLSALRQLVEAEVRNVDELCEWGDAVGWVGARPLTPDCNPLVGRTRVPGLLLNVGHSYNGWREGVLSARCLADVLDGTPDGAATPAFVQRAFSPQRFQLWAELPRRDRVS